MTLYFITGNKGKLAEAKAILGSVDSLDIDLPEIQELNAKRVIAAKLEEARNQYSSNMFCEDTSLHLDCLNGFPGPLIKWMSKSIGNQGIYELVQKYVNDQAIARTMIGLVNGDGLHYFSGTLEGKIVAPRGANGFGWDPVFQPDGHDKTLAEMTDREKNDISMRREALVQMKDYLRGKE